MNTNDHTSDCFCEGCLRTYPERRSRRLPDRAQTFRDRFLNQPAAIYPPPKSEPLQNCTLCKGSGFIRGGLNCDCWEVYLSGGETNEEVLMDASIAERYAEIGRRVRNGSESWACIDPYEVADWAAVLTPVEFGAWQDIRSAGLPLWPRLPVGDLIVSFGNPAAKVALQCGDTDERVDHWLTQTRWRVFRATATQCVRVMDSPADIRERAGEVSDEYRARYVSETLAGTIQDLRHALIACGVTL